MADAFSIVKLQRAMDVAQMRLKHPDVIATEHSAGFIYRPGRKTGVQVFVRLCKWSQARLEQVPDSGGLLCMLDDVPHAEPEQEKG